MTDQHQPQQQAVDTTERPNPIFEGTIDWNEYWKGADDETARERNPSTHHALDVLPSFLEQRGVPETFADVGCGGGQLVCEIAEQYPDTTVVGYDAARPVIESNRERVSEMDLENVEFEQAVLPDFHPDQQYDVVFSYFTLCYVEDVEGALETMYDAVAPGGCLLFNYQNTLAQSHWQQMADGPDELFEQAPEFEAGRFERRFELLLDGENLLSYDRIHDILGTWPQSVWSVVDKPDIEWTWRHHPLVYVPK